MAAEDGCPLKSAGEGCSLKAAEDGCSLKAAQKGKVVWRKSSLLQKLSVVKGVWCKRFLA